MRAIAAAEIHLEDLLRVARRSFIAAFRHLNDPAVFDTYLDKEMSQESLRRQLQNPDSRFFLFESEGSTVGYTKLNVRAAQTEPMDESHMEVERIYLLPEHQGNGLGRAMMEHAIVLAKSEGFTTLWLGVWQGKLDSIAFYKRMGFQKFGEHDFMMGDEPQTDDLMRLAL